MSCIFSFSTVLFVFCFFLECFFFLGGRVGVEYWVGTVLVGEVFEIFVPGKQMIQVRIGNNRVLIRMGSELVHFSRICKAC